LVEVLKRYIGGETKRDQTTNLRGIEPNTGSLLMKAPQQAAAIVQATR
jgi:hypothetical protein